MVNLKQLADGSMGLEGSALGDGEFVSENLVWTASSVDVPFYIASRAMVVKAITARPIVAGTDGSAVTAVIKKAPSGTALASGTALHSSTINLKGTIDTNQSLSITTTAATLAAGDCVGIDFTGTLTAAVGCVTIVMTPA